ncbi:MAG: phosphodiesterase [Clostridia bacterium]|nr:phosphodiesterase [Clostridia bacterium]
MKILIASDLHGSAYYARALAKRYEAEGADRLFLLGDLLYHGPRNPLPRDYAPKEVMEILNALKYDITAIRGNCDSEVDQMVLQFPIMADYTAVHADGKAFYLSHGHVYSPDAPMPLRDGDVLLCGHTHVPTVRRNGFLFLNPGSLSLPKEDSANSYLIYENGVFTFKNTDGEAYREEPWEE